MARNRMVRRMLVVGILALFGLVVSLQAVPTTVSAQKQPSCIHITQVGEPFIDVGCSFDTEAGAPPGVFDPEGNNLTGG
jgi:hypothetical protein